MDKQTLENYFALGPKLVLEPDFNTILATAEQNLGSVDSDTRENSLDLLWHLIETDVLAGDLCCALGSRMAAHLSHGLSQDAYSKDTVFLRTFSALILGVLVTHDERMYLLKGKSFLSKALYQTWRDAAFHYAKAERDFRGYVPDKGWAHATSHIADLLRDFSFHRYSNGAIQSEALHYITDSLTGRTSDVFLHNDDHRLARIVIVLLHRRTLSFAAYQEWLDALVDGVLKSLQSNDDVVSNAVRKLNTLSFLRALFFTLDFGMKNIKEIPDYETSPPLTGDLKAAVRSAIKRVDAGLNYKL